MASSGPPSESSLREEAICRLEKKRDFRVHARAYVAVNAMLVAIWAISGAGFFWPIFPLLGWGIGVSAHAWGLYGRRPISEEEIQSETERLRNR